MEQHRIISGNTIGNGNVFIQGNVSVNDPEEGLQKQAKHGVLKCLYTSPYQDRKDRNPPRVPGTCDWFVSHEHFRTWNESNSSAMLWVSADPGCGKSVLVRHLIDTVIQTTESRTVCYFFFKDDFPDQKNIISALSCILRQIFIQKTPLLSDEILKRFNSGGETFTTSFSKLWQTLLQVAEDKNAGEIVCLLDAIDECEDHGGQGRSKLLKALCTLYGTETRKLLKLKFLLTSRPYVGIYRGFQPVQLPGLPVIHLSGESEDEIKKISLEINIYIDARVKDIGERLHLSYGECDLLLRKLKSVPNRTYLWVYLVLDFIENSIIVDDEMIIEATRNMPTTVNEAYERILSKSFDAKQAKKILHIIAAAARPLTLMEMNFALALSEGDHQSYDDLGLVPDDRFRETLRNICGLCVVVVDSRVYLLHQSLKEFLVEKQNTHANEKDRGEREWQCSLSLHESHRILAEICIWHLLAGLKITFGSPTRQNWRQIFLDYSAKHWASHFRQMPIETQSMMTESVLMICDSTSSCCRAWFRSYWTTTNTELPLDFTTLMIVSYFGLNFAVSHLLTMADVELDAQDDKYQRSALCWAARNDFHIVSKLLVRGIRQKLHAFKLPFKKGAKVDLQDTFGRAPLTYAVWNGNVPLVQLLIRAGAQANLRDELDGTPLSYAFCSGHSQIIHLLAKRKRGVDIENDINRLLLSAAEKGHEEVMSLLLKTNRANIETRDLNGNTPLICATLFRHKAIMKLLLEAGAEINVHNKHGETPLLSACRRNHESIAELLLKAGADTNAHDKHGRAPLTIAGTFRHWTIVKLLLQAGADVNPPKDNQTPLKIAAEARQWTIVRLLLKAGADVKAYDRTGWTLIKLAVHNRQWAIVNLLIKAGADVNLGDKNDYTVLMKASIEVQVATVKLLLEAGVDVNAQRVGGHTALMRASFIGNETTVKLLLNAGADVNAHKDDGHTALMGASFRGHVAIVKLLLGAGADANACKKDGHTALMQASFEGQVDTVKLLLEAGADVNAQKEGGHTALMRASCRGNEETVKLLLNAGADVNAYKENGDTALMMAFENGHGVTAMLLQGAGGFRFIRDLVAGESE